MLNKLRRKFIAIAMLSVSIVLIAIVGTINLDYRSLVHHFECGVWMYRTPCIPDIKQDFLRLFARSQNMADFRQAWYTRWFCRLCATFFPLL